MTKEGQQVHPASRRSSLHNFDDRRSCARPVTLCTSYVIRVAETAESRRVEGEACKHALSIWGTACAVAGGCGLWLWLCLSKVLWWFCGSVFCRSVFCRSVFCTKRSLNLHFLPCRDLGYAVRSTNSTLKRRHRRGRDITARASSGRDFRLLLGEVSACI